MSTRREGIGTLVKRALVRAILEHSQDVGMMPSMPGSAEAEARFQVEHRSEDPEMTEWRAKVTARIEDGSICRQSITQCIRELNSTDAAHSKQTALVDCTREYSYHQMFDEWGRYARVFLALGMTGANGARVGIAGGIAAETLFAFFGLNCCGTTVSMLSYPDFLPSGTWRTMVEKERITDLILSDIMVTPTLWREIRQAKDELGLRNVILLHTRLGGPCVGPAELVYDEFNYHALHRMEGTVFMDDLLIEYDAAPAPKDDEAWAEGSIALITHTSGSTKGTRKPLPFTNEAINHAITHSAVSSFLPGGHVSTERFAPSFDFSSFLCCTATCLHLSRGDTVVLTFFGFMHPKFIRAIDYYQLSTLFTSGFIMDTWLARDDIDDIDFSSLHLLACGGSYVPPEKLRRYRAFARRHGYRHSLMRGYGMSETGGAQLVATDDCDDDTLGFPQSLEDVWIQDEEDHQFYRMDDGARVGVLYLASGSLSTGELDGETLFDYTEIEGRNFMCTNDLVRVNDDGSISYAGRADRYFVNNEGVRFEAGIVETRMAAQPCIGQCAVVPVLDKRIHDTVPVLYIVPSDKGVAAAEQVRAALAEVFVAGGLVERSNMPSQFILVDAIPCNTNGKIDTFRITRERLRGDAYHIVPVCKDGTVVDVAIEHAEQLDSITGGTLPEGMGASSAFGLYDMFNPTPSRADTRINALNPFDLPKLFAALKPPKRQDWGNGDESRRGKEQPPRR